MIPEEELHDMYWNQGMSQREIAKEIGVHPSNVANWMKKHKINARTKSESWLIRIDVISKEELERMYYDDKMSHRDISKETGMSRESVCRWAKKYGIDARTNSVSLTGKFIGENAGNWQGGISFEPYCYKFNNIFKEAVRERDDYTCQLCGYEQKLNGEKLSVHHIHYDKENCYPDVVALCRSCNGKVNSNRDYWEDFFGSQLIKRGLLNWNIN